MRRFLVTVQTNTDTVMSNPLSTLYARGFEAYASDLNSPTVDVYCVQVTGKEEPTASVTLWTHPAVIDVDEIL